MKSALHWKQLALEMPKHKYVYFTWIVPFTRHIVVRQFSNYQELYGMKENCSHSGNPLFLALASNFLCCALASVVYEVISRIFPIPYVVRLKRVQMIDARAR